MYTTIFIIIAQTTSCAWQGNRDALAPIVLRSLEAATAACQPDASGALPSPSQEGVPLAVLHKEAAYNAVGVGAYQLHDLINYNDWLHGSLLPVCYHVLIFALYISESFNKAIRWLLGMIHYRTVWTSIGLCNRQWRTAGRRCGR